MTVFIKVQGRIMLGLNESNHLNASEIIVLKQAI